jgi:hypothetical protein
LDEIEIEAPGKPEELDEIADDEEKSRDEMNIENESPEVRAQIEEEMKSLDSIVGEADDILEERMKTDALDSKRVKAKGEKIEGIDKGLEESEKINEKTHKDVGETPRAKRKWAKLKFTATVLGAVLATTATVGELYELFKKDEDEAKETTKNLTDKQRAVIKKLVDRWKIMPDDKFWKGFQNFVKNYSPSLKSQVLFMSYIKDISDPVDWTWSAKEKIAAVKELENAYFKNGKSADIYATISTLKHKGKLMPRSIAADICDITLTNIIDNLLLQKGGAG